MKKKITGFTDPKIAQKLKKQATSLEPKFNEKVGYPETLFGDLRCYVVEVSEEVTAAVDPLLILEKVGRGKGYITQRDRELNQNGNENDILDYWFSSPGVKVEIDIFNLTPKKYPIGTILLVKQDRDGDFWVCPTAQKHYKAKITVEPNHVPAHDDSIHWATLMEFDALTEDWIPVLEPDGQHKRVRVWDRNSDCCVLIGEMHDVQQVPSPDDEERWHWVGEAGLTREAIVLQSAQSGSPILAQLVYHPENSDCLGEVVSEQIVVCNKKGAVTQGERIIVHWVENAWVRTGGNATTGRIGFKMTGPRLRLRQSDGSRYGTATAIVEWIVGEVPVSIGDQVTVNFGGIRWAEAVKNCEGEADYFPSYSTPEGIVTEDIYVVTECQGLPLWIAFETTEDRDPYTPDQDVQATPIRAYGAAQDDLPIEYWDLSPTSSCGTFRFDCYDPDPQNPVFNEQGERVGIWRLLEACGEGCSAGGVEQIIGLQCVLTRPEQSAPCNGSDPQQQDPKFYVRYPQLKWPRALKGADGLAKLDNAAWSDDPADMRYVVAESNQQSTRVAGSLPATNCGDDFGVTGVETLDFWPFSQTPTLPLTIGNTHKGFAGYYWKASWSEPEQKYVVWDMQKTTVNASLEIKATFDEQTNCTTIAGSLLEIDIETCKQPTPVTLLSYRSQLQKFVDELELDTGQSGSGTGIQCDPVLRLKWVQLDVLTLCTGSTSGEDEIPLTQETVVVELNMDGCPTWTTSVIMVLGTCGNEAEHEAECEPCPIEGSGGEQ
jgi:hypothetical protein